MIDDRPDTSPTFLPNGLKSAEERIRDKKHWQAWMRWIDRRQRDGKYVEIKLLADIFSRKLHGKQENKIALREGYDRLYSSILNNEFYESDSNCILMVSPGVTTWRLTKENLKTLPSFGDFLIDGYLAFSWVPRELATKWLATFDIVPPHGPLSSSTSKTEQRATDPKSASSLAKPDVAKRRKGGLDYSSSDKTLLIEMHTMIVNGQVPNRWHAARLLADRAEGSNRGDSKAKRLLSKYLKWRDKNDNDDRTV